jgi:hypothetical protein
VSSSPSASHFLQETWSLKVVLFWRVGMVSGWGCACLLSCIVLLWAEALQPPDQYHIGGLQSCHWCWLKFIARGAHATKWTIFFFNLQTQMYLCFSDLLWDGIPHVHMSWPLPLPIFVWARVLHFNIFLIKNQWFFLMPLHTFYMLKMDLAFLMDGFLR